MSLLNVRNRILVAVARLRAVVIGFLGDPLY
jgi:hypothetical protein